MYYLGSKLKSCVQFCPGTTQEWIFEIEVQKVNKPLKLIVKV